MAESIWSGTTESDAATLTFTNVRVLDATGEPPFSGEVVVQGNRIKEVRRTDRSSYSFNRSGGGQTIDGGGATLMPCLLYTSPSPRDGLLSRMPSSA